MKTYLRMLFVMSVFFNCSTVVCSAQDESIWEWSGYSDVRSQYIGGTSGMTIVPEAVVQPSITLSRGGYHANVWMSFHWDDPARIRQGDEIDLSAGYAWWFAGKVKNDITFSYYDLYPLSTSHGDLFAICDELIFPAIAGWTPSINLEWDIPENKQVLPGGLFYKVNFSHDMSINGTKIVGDIAVGGHGDACGLQSETVGFVRGTVSVPITTRYVVVSPSFMAQWGGENGGMADDRFYLGLRFSF